MSTVSTPKTGRERPVDHKTLLQAYELMCVSKCMAETYDENKEVCSKYVHSTSRGHEAIQLAAGLQLTPHDYASHTIAMSPCCWAWV